MKPGCWSLWWMAVGLVAAGCGDSFEQAAAGSGGDGGSSGSGGTAGTADAAAGTGGGGAGGSSDASIDVTPPDAPLDAITTDTTPPSDGSACALGTKLCNGTCVPADPQHGCDQLSCAPCAGVNQTATCSTSGACVTVCSNGWGDCDSTGSNGCETDVNSNPADCGRCNHDCLGGGCAGGACQPVVLSTATFSGVSGGNITLDAANVYFTIGSGTGTGRVGRVAKGGGAPTWLASNQGSPRGIAVDAQFAYWADMALNSIYRFNLSSYASNLIVSSTNVGPPLALGPTSLFWADGATHRIVETGWNGTQINAFTVGVKITSLTFAAGRVYWTTATEVATWDPASSNHQLLASGQGQATSVKVTGGRVFWSDTSQSEIRSVQETGGSLQTVTSGKAIAIAVDLTDVYWSDNAGGTIQRASRTGGPSTVIASGQSFPFDVAVDAAAVYWILETGGQVLKVAK